MTEYLDIAITTSGKQYKLRAIVPAMIANIIKNGILKGNMIIKKCGDNDIGFIRDGKIHYIIKFIHIDSNHQSQIYIHYNIKNNTKYPDIFKPQFFKTMQRTRKLTCDWSKFDIEGADHILYNFSEGISIQQPANRLVFHKLGDTEKEYDYDKPYKQLSKKYYVSRYPLGATPKNKYDNLCYFFMMTLLLIIPILATSLSTTTFAPEIAY